MSTAPTRERLLVAAMELFGRQGYRATTIGAIEEAAGLAPRRGGLYRHFDSKEELFRAAVLHHARKFTSYSAVLDDLDLTDEGAVLHGLALMTLAGLEAEADLFRLLARDGPDFPDLTDHVHETLVRRGYELTTTLFTELLDRRGLATTDAAALGAIALGALVHHAEDLALYGHPPGDVPTDLFVETWVRTWLEVLDARVAAGADGD